MDFFHLTVTSGLTRGGVHPKFWVLFFLGSIAMSYFLCPTLDFSHECKEETWIISTGQRHGGSPGEGFTLKFGRFFPWWALPRAIFSVPHCRGSGFFST